MPLTTSFGLLCGQAAPLRAAETGDPVQWQRRAFLGRTAGGLLGSIAWSWLNALDGGRQTRAAESAHTGPHHPPRAQRIICLFQNGGPSQMDLFDPKPELARLSGQPYPGKQKVET